MNRMYSGYASARKAWTLLGIDIVVMQYGKRTAVLQGADAAAFKATHRALTHHSCGVEETAAAAQLIAAAGSVERAYDALYDEMMK